MAGPSTSLMGIDGVAPFVRKDWPILAATAGGLWEQRVRSFRQDSGRRIGKAFPDAPELVSRTRHSLPTSGKNAHSLGKIGRQAVPRL